MRIIGNRVLAAPDIQAKIGSIFLPAAVLDHNNTGGPKVYKVLAVGTGRTTKKGVLIPLPIEAGDKVICHSFTNAPQESGLDDGTYFITEDQILAVIPQQKPNQTETC